MNFKWQRKVADLQPFGKKVVIYNILSFWLFYGEPHKQQCILHYDVHG